MTDVVARLNAALSGRYRVERQLGEGGMATVYLAEDLKHERRVALKVLKPELAAAVGAERFLAEIKTTAKLQHTHILPLHDSGTADGLLFYVMPHVEGESLADRLDREHQLPVDQAVRIATNVAGGEVREILTGTMACYAATGHVVYATAEGTLMAAPFDVRRLEVTGPSVALVEGVLVVSTSASQFALSESGTLLYSTGGAGAVAELVWVSRAGQAEPVDPAWTGALASPSLSPDGTRLVVTLLSESTDVWVKKLDRGPSLKLTFEGGRNDYPAWTPDGGR